MFWLCCLHESNPEQEYLKERLSFFYQVCVGHYADGTIERYIDTCFPEEFLSDYCSALKKEYDKEETTPPAVDPTDAQIRWLENCPNLRANLSTYIHFFPADRHKHTLTSLTALTTLSQIDRLAADSAASTDQSSFLSITIQNKKTFDDFKNKFHTILTRALEKKWDSGSENNRSRCLLLIKMAHAIDVIGTPSSAPINERLASAAGQGECAKLS